MRKLLKNLLFQYTVATFILTALIAMSLSIFLINASEKHAMRIHSAFYQNFVKSIPENYEELMPLMLQKDYHIDSHEIEHFSKDALLFQSIKNISIINRYGEIVWQQKNQDREIPVEEKKLIDKASQEGFSYFISDETNLIIYIPVEYQSSVSGIIKIEDSDDGTKKLISDARKTQIFIVFIGGTIFYILLFFLFFRAYRSQSKAYNRIEHSQAVTIYSMSMLAELRDNETGAHITRTSAYCRMIAENLKTNRDYKSYLSDDYIKDLVRSAPLHDIGKVGVPDNILLKAGRLSKEEFDIIKKHPQMGAQVLQKAAIELDYRTFFEIGIQIVLHHHENWDGSGYPEGLSGRNIPLSARIMALADVYDALRSERPYKEAFSHKKTIEIIKSDSGKKFDPAIVTAFLNSEKEFEYISMRYRDQSNYIDVSELQHDI